MEHVGVAEDCSCITGLLPWRRCSVTSLSLFRRLVVLYLRIRHDVFVQHSTFMLFILLGETMSLNCGHQLASGAI
jgi:hypothetical protein